MRARVGAAKYHDDSLVRLTPWAATAVVAVPQNSQQRILLETRGARRQSSQSLLDLRVSKTVAFSSLGRIELLVDVLNALNDTAVESLADLSLICATDEHLVLCSTITATYRPPMHPASLRCSSVKYSRYSPSSRLAIRAPRRPNTSP